MARAQPGSSSICRSSTSTACSRRCEAVITPRSPGPPRASPPPPGDLFDVVHQGEELSLSVHLILFEKEEAAHALVLEIGKDWLDGAHTLAVDLGPKGGVEYPAHALCGGAVPRGSFGQRALAAFDDGELALPRAVRFTRAPIAQ